MIDRLEELMARWRKRDELSDRGTWKGVREIAGNLSMPVNATRNALRDLADAGKIERGEFTNGTYWRGLASEQSS